MTIDQLFERDCEYHQDGMVFTFYDVPISGLTWATVSIDLRNHIVEFYDAQGNLHEERRVRVYSL